MAAGLENIASLLGGQYEAVLLLVVFGFVATLVVGLVVAFRPDRVAKRMQNGDAADSGAARPSLRYRESGGDMPKVLEPLRRALLPKDDTRLSQLRRRLAQAGYYDPSAVGYYYGIRIMLALLLPPAAAVALSLGIPNMTPARIMLAVLAGAVVGFYLPAFAVSQRIKTRQREIREGFPDTLDLLLVCVEAGLGLSAAINRVGSEIGRASRVLSEQFRLMALEMQAGTSRETALRNFAWRTGVAEVNSFVSLLVQSDKLGSSIGQSLRVHAAEMRQKRSLRAEEAANKLPVKLSIPLVLFFVPCLLLVIMTPLVIRAVRILGPTLTGGAS
jgi:tight adherence protein C